MTRSTFDIKLEEPPAKRQKLEKSANNAFSRRQGGIASRIASALDFSLVNASVGDQEYVKTTSALVKVVVANSLDNMSNDNKGPESNIARIDSRMFRNTKQIVKRTDGVTESTPHAPKSNTLRVLKPDDVPIMTLIIAAQIFDEGRYILTFEESLSGDTIIVKEDNRPFVVIMGKDIWNVEVPSVICEFSFIVTHRN
jgi:hypothetical protein